MDEKIKELLDGVDASIRSVHHLADLTEDGKMMCQGVLDRVYQLRIEIERKKSRTLFD